MSNWNTITNWRSPAKIGFQGPATPKWFSGCCQPQMIFKVLPAANGFQDAASRKWFYVVFCYERCCQPQMISKWLLTRAPEVLSTSIPQTTERTWITSLFLVVLMISRQINIDFQLKYFFAGSTRTSSFSNPNFSELRKVFRIKNSTKNDPSLKTPNLQSYRLTRSELGDRLIWNGTLDSLQGVVCGPRISRILSNSFWARRNLSSKFFKWTSWFW